MHDATDDPELAEHRRLRENAARTHNWQRWGPYLSERQWGTVREDYSADGSCWEYFPHDHARSRAYRWGEDGLLGFTDRQCRLCFAVAMWNGRDPILKERLFGLTGPEGNHGEDCKELYYYLDSTPTHSYARALYKYPQAEFPYAELRRVNAERGLHDREYELEDTGVFDASRYFDVYAEYAKAAPDDVLIRLTVVNRGPEPATLHLLPSVWFRNTWIWGCEHEDCTPRPLIRRSGPNTLELTHEMLRTFTLEVEALHGAETPFLFTENETNTEKLFAAANSTPYVKDAFHEAVVGGRADAVNPEGSGTKAAACFERELGPGESLVLRLRLHEGGPMQAAFGDRFDAVFSERKQEADAFYRHVIPADPDTEEARVQRQAYAGLLWTKQFYYYSVKDWLRGDPGVMEPPPERWHGRNADWQHHLFNRDVISMPDKWEYPWYAAWDLAFQMIPFALIDPEFAKSQLLLLLREWYMHPNGEIPAYEFALGDVNPPVHAWACWRVYKISADRGTRDRRFLAAAFHKLLINFTWWVNRKDPAGNHLFSGGFLGLDNIGIFDRSKPLPSGGHIEQSDGTAWMASYCLTMLAMALELASEDDAYEGVASKFFEHFVAITDAMNRLGGTGLWDEEDGFYYDQIRVDCETRRVKVRSLVGLIPLFAVEVLPDKILEKLPRFRKRMDWFLTHRRDLARHITYMEHGRARGGCRLLAVPARARLERVLERLLDEKEFLSSYGIRSMSRVHSDQPFSMHLAGQEYAVRYTPGESETYMFGGNSNWRGPVWLPVNYMLIEALERFYFFYGDSLQVECPVGSGQWMDLRGVARELASRLVGLFLPGPEGGRPCNGGDPRYRDDPHFRDLVLFHEYFHGETGRGCGASHQTGWTALAAKLLRDLDRSLA